MAFDITLALFKLRPGEEYGRLGPVIDEASYNRNIVWRAVTTKPTFTELSVSLNDSELDIARINKNNEIDSVSQTRINARVPSTFSVESICLLGLITPGLSTGSLSADVAAAANIASFAEKRKKQINTQALAAVGAYDPNTDPAFPS